MILHFRYRSKYLDQELLKQVSSGNAAGREVMVCYLFQEYKDKKWEPKSIHPLRSGTIVKAHILGPEVHIYFAVTGYPTADGIVAIVEMATAAFNRDGDLYFASSGGQVAASLVSTEAKDADAFTCVVDQLQEQQLTSLNQADQVVQMDPLFYRVQGIYESSGKGKPQVVAPTSSAGVSDRERGFLIRNSNPLELRVQFHQPKWSNIDRRHITLVLDADADNFSVPKNAKMPIASPYDESVFYVLPRRDNIGWITRIGFYGTDEKGPVDSVTRFDALVRATAIVPPVVTRLLAALSPAVSVLIAVVALIVSAFGSADSIKVLAKITTLGWVIIIACVVLGLAITVGSALAQTYSRDASK
jgi:hypothetical protein